MSNRRSADCPENDRFLDALKRSQNRKRTQSGIIRAKAAGKQFGRPPVLNPVERMAVVERLKAGACIAEIAREFKTSRQTIMRVRESKFYTTQ